MNDNTIVQSGKYKGYRLGDVPRSVLEFMFENNKAKGQLKNYIASKFYNSIA